MITDNGWTLVRAQSPLKIWLDGGMVHMSARYLESLRVWLEETLKEVQLKIEEVG